MLKDRTSLIQAGAVETFLNGLKVCCSSKDVDEDIQSALLNALYGGETYETPVPALVMFFWNSSYLLVYQDIVRKVDVRHVCFILNMLHALILNNMEHTDVGIRICMFCLSEELETSIGCMIIIQLKQYSLGSNLISSISCLGFTNFSLVWIFSRATLRACVYISVYIMLVSIFWCSGYFFIRSIFPEYVRFCNVLENITHVHSITCTHLHTHTTI
jgi:hypothetical protein